MLACLRFCASATVERVWNNRLEFFGRVARTSTTSSEIGTRVTRPMLIEIELGTYHFREGERITIILDGAAGAQVTSAPSNVQLFPTIFSKSVSEPHVRFF